MRSLKALAFVALLAFPLSAQAAGMTVTRVSFDRLPAWQQDNQGEALAAFQRSCTKLQGVPEGKEIGVGIFAAPAESWRHVCGEARMVNPADTLAARAFFERAFTPMVIAVDGSNAGKFTGYYEPLMRGSWQRKSGYQEAVYGRPADLPRDGGMYPLKRRDIDGGALAGKGLERMYINDPVDLFFLHVQGSGRVLMDTGETVALRFDGKNNQPYTAIGKVLIERGELTRETVSAPAIRDWLHAHPDQAREVMRKNDSFVFFRVVKDEKMEGPVGAQNVPLTPERSLAVDTTYIPLGMPLWLDTSLPQSHFGKGEAYQRLMVAQDKGSAITGAIRGDVFFGFGARAEDLAGHMNSAGHLVALVPQDIARRIDGKLY